MAHPDPLRQQGHKRKQLGVRFHLYLQSAIRAFCPGVDPTPPTPPESPNVAFASHPTEIPSNHDLREGSTLCPTPGAAHTDLVHTHSICFHPSVQEV